MERDPVDVRLHLTVLAVSVGSCSAPLAMVPVAGVEPSPLARWVVSLLGPLAGWIDAVETHQVGQALDFLLVATLTCAIPLGVYVFTRQAEWLGVAAMAWVTVGWVLGVAIWI